jgi:hypothetical protein
VSIETPRSFEFSSAASAHGPDDLCVDPRDIHVFSGTRSTKKTLALHPLVGLELGPASRGDAAAAPRLAVGTMLESPSLFPVLRYEDEIACLFGNLDAATHAVPGVFRQARLSVAFAWR